MLSIGEFSKICSVSTKTLRYYAEIELILPSEINPENGYRYYAIDQLETMLFINRLKSYGFSLEEIKVMIDGKNHNDELLYAAFVNKRSEIQKRIEESKRSMDQLNDDIEQIKQGKSIMNYLNEIDVQLVEIPLQYLLSIRKCVPQNEMKEAYSMCFGKLIKRVQKDNLTIIAPPMVLFHSDEFLPSGLDIEFAIPIKEYVTGTRDFQPGLCLKTTLKGSYIELSSVYAKQIKWAELNGYENTGALFEVYVNTALDVASDEELITEVYYPVKKKTIRR